MGMDADYIKAQFAKLSDKNKRFLELPENQGATPGILPDKAPVPRGGIHGKLPKKKYPKGEKAPGWRNVNLKVQEKHIDD